MNTAHKILVVVSLSTLSVACASDGEEAAASWQGSEPHLSVRGYLNGEDLDIQLSGDAATASNLWCGRKYVGPPDANGEPDVTTARLYKTNVYAQVKVGVEARRFELEFKPHDFQTNNAPRVVKVVPRVDDESVASDSMWVDMEWHTPDGETDLLETSAQTGAFELKMYSGQPGEDGLMIPEGDGSFGGYLSAKWSEQEYLEVSMTAPCTENELDVE
ncbi:MAG TPA: hypothetical protein VER33_20375 [Polyangiaceae bacterium]|nr:hypothetical protein [Polyangiaceae bacterium]